MLVAERLSLRSPGTFYFLASLAPSLDAGSISLPLIVINKAISRQGEMSLRTSQP